MGRNSHRRSIVLLQVPFASHNNASLGLIRVKSVLASEGFNCRIEFLDHELEAELGEEIACDFHTSRDSYWLIELLYAAELFPHHLDRGTFQKRASAILRGADLPALLPSPASLRETFHKFNQRILKRWEKSFPYDAVGISCNYNVMPALYFASSIKALHPRGADDFGREPSERRGWKCDHPDFPLLGLGCERRRRDGGRENHESPGEKGDSAASELLTQERLGSRLQSQNGQTC